MRMTAKRRKSRAPDRPAQVATAPVVAAPSLRAHGVHLGLMLGALALAYVLPFELLVLAYAILGPAHYLTEISWLHDRRYFLPHRGFAALLAIVALVAMFQADTARLGAWITFCFLACAILALHRTRGRTLVFLAIAAVTCLALASLGVPFGLAWVLLPTLIHVSVFTFVFMLVGALRSRSSIQLGLVATYVASIGAIFAWPPSATTVIPSLAHVGATYFGDIAPALGSVLGIPDVRFDARLTGLLSFAYTYHYLNWFIKADVIKWHAVPRPRLVAIAALSAAATALYFYDYETGFMVLLLLSLLHVLLEFPLNSISLRQLGGGFVAAISPASAR